MQIDHVSHTAPFPTRDEAAEWELLTRARVIRDRQPDDWGPGVKDRCEATSSPR